MTFELTNNIFTLVANTLNGLLRMLTGPDQQFEMILEALGTIFDEHKKYYQGKQLKIPGNTLIA